MNWVISKGEHRMPGRGMERALPNYRGEVSESNGI